MRWGLLALIGQRFARLRRSGHAPAREIAPEFTTEELADFLEGDLYPTDARPEFKEQLRNDLWIMVQEIHGTKRGGA